MKTIRLTIDGQEVFAAAGATVLEAAHSAGIFIPTLCHDAHLKPYGACRLCIVQIDGLRGLPTACTTPAQEGMVVTTETQEVQRIRRGIVELAIADHPSDCLSCFKSAECELLRVARYLGVEKASIDRLRRPVAVMPVDRSNPAFDFDPNKCILCGKCVRVCDEIQGLGAIDLAGRGYRARISTFAGQPWADSICQTCGECVERCPTGALTPKNPVAPQREVKTICPFCGVGCSIRVGVRANRIVGVRGAADSPVNQGGLCVKGRFGLDFVNHPERLTHPLIRKEGVPRSLPVEAIANGCEIFRQAGWDEALDLVAARLKEIHAKDGPGALGVLSSAKCTNEENYLVQKFARAVLGTNNVDHCARLCHASTVMGAQAAFGGGAMSNSIADIAQAETILVIGSNTTECHPIIARRIKHNVRENGARLIVADPRATELARLAEVHLNHRPGTDVALLNGLMHRILEAEWHDKAFIRRHCEAFQPFKKSLAAYPPQIVASITGVPAEKIGQAAEIFGRAGTAVVVYGMGITQHTTGVDNVKAVANLLLLTGNMGRAGTGFSPLRGQNNVQGACDMGALPNVFPGYQRVGELLVQTKFSEAWGVELNYLEGLPLTDMLAGADRNELRGMFIMGENPLMSEPDLGHARRAMGKLHFLAVQDIFLNETALFADVVLPAASFAEKDGSFTSTERRIQLVRRAVRPPGNARQDWQIIGDIADRLGYSMRYASTGKIMEEIAALTPIYGGISHPRLERTGGLQWPCWSDNHPGTPRLHEGSFARGRGRFHVVTYRPPAEQPSEQYPTVLTTGRVLSHYHTGSMSRRARVLETLEPESHVDISPGDAGDLGVQEGDLLRIRSPRGEITTKAHQDERVPSGMAFMAFHWHEAPANVLTNAAVDPAARIPEFKVAAVRIEKVSECLFGMGLLERI
ncbi:MAG: formate dehydrogenase subunit alpha [Desulfobacteraceae bacterium]|nr:MAG: formate dehydrogenase subunit alpha [Desulfobacteraceae bacterium]